MITVNEKNKRLLELFYYNKHINHDGSKNESIDGTGYDPTVTYDIAKNILKYIKSLFVVENKTKLRVLDVGAGIGYLQRLADLDPFFDMYSFEGCDNLLELLVCNKNKFAICDIAKLITNKELEKAFHLTTSFEVIEHITRDSMNTFFDNMIYMSDYHLCSIHCANEENNEHKTIQQPQEWENYFISKNISFIKLGDYPVNKNDDIFREETGLHNWVCSAIYLLVFN